MVYIPDNQIPSPSFHADDLGFVFRWKGHLLRGIYPNAIEQAKRYFDSGFIKEIEEKKLFPKTWISDFENKQFGLILEHELIEPVTYATEWNFQMLKDAALMVLDIAQVGQKYGYNMIDCHKLNVMFQNNRPVYVDLGSFVENDKGVSGWKPYPSFLRSYYYILDLWSKGCSQIAKRMMAPHVELQARDYWLFKRPLYRAFPFLLKCRLYCYLGLNEIVFADEQQFKGLLGFLKRILTSLKLFDSQNLRRVYTKIKRKNITQVENTRPSLSLSLKDTIPIIESCNTATFINCGGLDNEIIKEQRFSRILSINSDNLVSGKEYLMHRNNGYGFQSLSYDVSIPIFTHGKEPESRFCSDIVVVGNMSVDYQNRWSIHNILIQLKNYEHYSLSGTLVILTKNVSQFKDVLAKQYSILHQDDSYGIVVKVK